MNTITRRPKFEDTHKRTTHWIDERLLETIVKVVGDEKGGMTEFWNRAATAELQRMGVLKLRW